VAPSWSNIPHDISLVLVMMLRCHFKTMAKRNIVISIFQTILTLGVIVVVVKNGQSFVNLL